MKRRPALHLTKQNIVLQSYGIRFGIIRQNVCMKSVIKLAERQMNPANLLSLFYIALSWIVFFNNSICHYKIKRMLTIILLLAGLSGFALFLQIYSMVR